MSTTLVRLLALALIGLFSLASLAQPADDPAWTWSPEPRWLGGAGLSSYSSFEGGLDYGDQSSFGFPTKPEATIPVDIVFDETVESTARVFRQNEGFANVGVGVFNGTIYDVSDPSAPRRLNVAILENDGNGVWNPSRGSREYLFVLPTSYDGDGSTYAGVDFVDLNVAYILVGAPLDGRTLFETNPATLSIRPPALRHVSAFTPKTGTLWAEWTPYVANGAATVRVYLDDGAGERLAGTTSADAQWLALSGLDPATEYGVRVEALDGDGAVLGDVSVRERPELPHGIEAASHLDPRRSSFLTYGDVWGYTAPDGTEYALLAARASGLSVIDITNAPEAPPIEASFVPRIEGVQDAKDVKVYGHHAYVVNERGPMQIIDLSDPLNPVQVGMLDTQPDVEAGGAHNVAVFNGHLWVTGGRITVNAGVRVYDVRTTPEAPVLVGEFKPEHHARPYYHDFEVKGDYGFGPSISGDGVDILNVSDPANITLVTTFTYPNGGGPHNTCASEDGNTLYVGNEVRGGNWTRIFDISDVNNVELVGDIIIDEEAVVHNCYVRGDLLYIAHYTEGLRVFDIRDPHAPVEVAFYDTFLPSFYGFAGAWTAYPYFDSGKVIVSDMQSGLFVITLDADLVADEADPETAAATLSVAPNPTRSQAALTLQLDAPAPVRLSVFDVRGRELRVLLDEPVGTDRQRVALDTSSLAPGAYVIRLAVEGEAPISQMLTVVR